MKILCILKKEPSESVRKIIEVQSKENEVKVLRLGEVADYKNLVEDIYGFDKRQGYLLVEHARHSSSANITRGFNVKICFGVIIIKKKVW